MTTDGRPRDGLRWGRIAGAIALVAVPAGSLFVVALDLRIGPRQVDGGRRPAVPGAGRASPKRTAAFSPRATSVTIARSDDAGFRRPPLCGGCAAGAGRRTGAAAAAACHGGSSPRSFNGPGLQPSWPAYVDRLDLLVPQRRRCPAPGSILRNGFLRAEGREEQRARQRRAWPIPYSVFDGTLRRLPHEATDAAAGQRRL